MTRKGSNPMPMGNKPVPPPNPPRKPGESSAWGCNYRGVRTVLERIKEMNRMKVGSCERSLRGLNEVGLGNDTERSWTGLAPRSMTEAGLFSGPSEPKKNRLWWWIIAYLGMIPVVGLLVWWGMPKSATISIPVTIPKKPTTADWGCRGRLPGDSDSIVLYAREDANGHIMESECQRLPVRSSAPKL